MKKQGCFQTEKKTWIVYHSERNDKGCPQAGAKPTEREDTECRKQRISDVCLREKYN